MIKKIFIGLLCLYIIFLAFPSGMVTFFITSICPYDVSQEPKYAAIYNQTFETQVELFLSHEMGEGEMYLYEYERSGNIKLEKGTRLIVKEVKWSYNPFAFVSTTVKVKTEIIDPRFAGHKRVNISHLIRDYSDMGYSNDLAQVDPRYLKNVNIQNLHTAVQYGNLEAVIQLAENGNDVNQKDYNGKTPLHYAKQLDIVLYLLEKGAQCRVADKSGKTLLHYAAQDDHKDIVEHMIKCGAEINEQDKEGNTPLLIAAKSKNSDIAVYLLEKGADPRIKNNNQDFVLFEAVMHDQLDVVKLSLELGANPSEVASLSSMIGLFKAVQNRNLEMIKILLKAGTPVNSAKADSGETALHYAYDQLPILQLLIENGADIQQVDKKGRTVLHSACKGSSELEVIQFLYVNGSRINQGDIEGITPFLHACNQSDRYINIESIKWMIEHGACINQSDNNGNTALHYAFTILPVLQMLVENGADLQLVNNEGQTVLHKACYYSDSPLKVVEFLCSNGCQIDQGDNKGKTPLHYAISAAWGGNREITKWLVQHGASRRKLDRFDIDNLELLINSQN